ncbi:hypothetical protein [Actinoplanes sp. NPDC023714]|uniref:hypothetical protein n=1 Tax=Actinoplanes sp. NPDC023714 TaxID=3154322 RepID=UPI0033D751CB
MVDKRLYQSGEVIGRDVRAVVVGVEILLLEERLVQYAAGALARSSVQLLRIFEQAQQIRQGLAGGIQPGGPALGGGP